MPVVSIVYMYIHSEQEREEEKGMPMVVMKDSRTKTITAKVVPNKGVVDYVVGVVKKMIEQLGRKRV